MASRANPSKLCLRCRQVKPVTDFFKNRLWTAQKYCDTVCRDCAKEMVCDKESLRKYFWDNNRLWVDGIWDAAKRKAERSYSVNPEYLDKKTSLKKKQKIEDDATAKAALGMMSLEGYYQYCENNTDEDGEYREFDADSSDGSLILDAEGAEVYNSAKKYSKEWEGLYTQNELQYLDEYYQRLDSEFVLGDVVMQDYAKKIAQASLEANRKGQKMREGTCSFQEWQQAQKMFDDLCKSSNFAACQRKSMDSNGLGSVSEIIMNIEINHHAECPEIHFPPDDIDKILADFAHTEVAIQ